MNRLASLLWQIYGVTGTAAQSIFETLLFGYGLVACALVAAIVVAITLLVRKK